MNQFYSSLTVPPVDSTAYLAPGQTHAVIVEQLFIIGSDSMWEFPPVVGWYVVHRDEYNLDLIESLTVKPEKRAHFTGDYALITRTEILEPAK